MILHEWTKQSGFFKDEEEQRYSIYECTHCHETMRYYNDLTWGESINLSKTKMVCTSHMIAIQPQLALGRA